MVAAETAVGADDARQFRMAFGSPKWEPQGGFCEYLMPGFGGDLNTDVEYRRFVRTWKHTSGAIEAMTPTRVKRLGDRKEFRGYYVDKWYATAWRDERKWKTQAEK